MQVIPLATVKHHSQASTKVFAKLLMHVGAHSPHTIVSLSSSLIPKITGVSYMKTRFAFDEREREREGERKGERERNERAVFL